MLRQFEEELPNGKRMSLWPTTAREPDVKSPWPWLLPMVLVACVLRVGGLNRQLWFDEIATLVLFVRQPFSSLVTTYSSQNQHFLYSILAWISIRIFGEQPWTLRLPAMLFGILSIPTLYFTARQLTNRREALWASALMVVSYHHVWFSQNARGYSGILFFTLLASYLFIRASREDNRALWVAYGVSVALGMYTHLSMGFIVVGHGLIYLWLLAGRRVDLARRPAHFLLPALGFAVALLLTLAFYSPALPQLVSQALASRAKPIQMEWSSPFWLLQETVRGLALGKGYVGVGAVAVGGLIALAGLASYWRENRYGVGLMLLPAFVTGMVLTALGHNLWPRLFFFEIGFGLMFLVRGVTVGSEVGAHRLGHDPPFGARLQTGALVVILLASAWSVRAVYRYPKQDYAGAMQFVESRRRPGDVVVTLGLASFPYERYYGRDWPAVESVADLEALRSHAGRIWLLYTFPIYVRTEHADVWDIIHKEFATIRVFQGTVGGGEIYVCRWPPR